jgi:hypothetical protein
MKIRRNNNRLFARNSETTRLLAITRGLKNMLHLPGSKLQLSRTLASAAEDVDEDLEVNVNIAD